MTSQNSFSDLLQVKLNEDTAEAERAKKAIEEIEWRQRVNTIARWLQTVFNDDSFELLGYKLKKRKKSRADDHFLTVYVQVNGLVFALETSQNLNRHTANIGICVLRTGRSGVNSQLFKLKQIYKENNNLQRLEFQADFSELNSQPITSDTDQGRMCREHLLKEIVIATANVLRRKPNLARTDSTKQILADLPNHKGMNMLTTEANQDDTDVSSPFVQDETEYFASIHPELLNMTISEMMGEYGYTDDIHKLHINGVVTVSDLIALTYDGVNGLTNRSFALIMKLAEYDLELKPSSESPRLAPGIPKSVDLLLNTSGLSYIERPYNCLARAQIVSTRQLIDQTASDLLAITNFGKVSLATTKEALKQHGLRLRPSGPDED